MIVDKKEILNEDGSIGYVELLIKSDNILKTTYFPKDNRLYISFSKGGQTYSYSNISLDLYGEFEQAESHGSFFHKRIRNNDSYPFRKEFTLYPNEITDAKSIINEKLLNTEINE